MERKYHVFVSSDGNPVSIMNFECWYPETLDDAMNLIKALERICHGYDVILEVAT